MAKFTWRAEEEMGENHLDEHEEKEVVRIIGGWNVWWAVALKHFCTFEFC